MSNLSENLKKIKLLVLDVDGVLTDGRLYYGPNGHEMKVFHVHDGLGIKLLQKSGIKVAIISSRDCPEVTRRMNDLGVEFVYQGQKNKKIPFAELCHKLKLTPHQVAYMGDDLPDLPLILQAGVGISVPNGHPVVKEGAKWITNAAGGLGAVREVCDGILRAQNTFTQLLEPFHDTVL